MARLAWTALAVAVGLLACAHAQNDGLSGASAAAAGPGGSANSEKFSVAADGGCQTYVFPAGDRSPGFNYSARLGVPSALPTGCNLEDLTITKLYTSGSCPSTRANNYAATGATSNNDCSDKITTNTTDTCNNVINKAGDADGFATKGIAQGEVIDAGNVCWKPENVYLFVKNSCNQPIDVTIKVTFSTYYGTCTDSADTDDGGDDAGGSGSSSSGGKKLSGGAIAGIVIGVIVGVALIAFAVWFFCCQLRKQ